MDNIEIDNDFDGVFRFTNATDEDFSTLWNNKEYTFPKQSTVPLIIPEETGENIQEIRKRFAYRLAQREFYKGKIYKTLEAQGKKSLGGVPPLYDEVLLQPVIDSCLKPLPEAKMKVKGRPKASDKQFRASKALAQNDNPNELFKDDVPVAVGKMPDKV